MKSVGESWQLVNAAHDEGDGLTLCEHISYFMTALIVMLTSRCCGGDFSAIS
jgi:hypothetical protein